MSLQCFDQEQVSPLVSPAFAPPSSTRHPRSLIALDDHFEGSLTEKQIYHCNGEGSKEGQSRVPIDMIPDDALLEIFDFYLSERGLYHGATLRAWCKLAHVCRKWRNVVFGSPRRLNLRLLCIERTPVKEMLGVWPPLPIDIEWYGYNKDEDNIIAALEHQDRISRIYLRLGVSSSKIFAAMQQPFPALTLLSLSYSDSDHITAVPASFLGGSAPHLKYLYLYEILFPGLPKLLLSATQLVQLHLCHFPCSEYVGSGYVSPEEMATCLSVLTRLKKLEINFKFSQSHPDLDLHPPPQTRVFLPVLVYMTLSGAGEYFENLVARIDAPLLEELSATFDHEISDIPQFTEFIRRTPKVKAHVRALSQISYQLEIIPMTPP